MFLRYQASIEELNMDPKRGMDKAQIADLITGGYIERGEPLLISGATGVRKKLSGLSPWFKSMLTGKKGLIFQSTEAAPANQDCQTGRINAQTSGQDCKS